MSHSQKTLICYLLQGYYMAPSLSRTGAAMYRVYDPEVNVVYRIRKKTADHLHNLYRKDKKGRYTLNLSAVRGLSKRHFVKQEYLKQRKFKNEKANHLV